jgi:CRP/FNR family transcriptional regulator, nitrogen fixation regulation protein
MLKNLATRNGRPDNLASRNITPHRPISTHGPVGSIDQMGTVTSFTRNSEIYGEGEPAEYFYKVVSGAVRTYKVLNDGRRQIGDFYLPSEMFGLETNENHTYSAEAITDTQVRVIKRSTVIALAAQDNNVAKQLWALTGWQLNRVQNHILLMIKSAEERVAGFLLEIADRNSSAEVRLPMSRQDIADYLGLTIETVSRTLTHLNHSSTITFQTSRQILLRDRVALKKLDA